MAKTPSTINAELVEAFGRDQRRLRNIARRAGEQDVEDIVQDAFLRVVETSRREDVRAVDNLLSRVVRCVAIDRLRRRASRLGVMEPEAEQGGVDLAADPERSLMGSQRLRQVMETIDAMPPRRREVFLLHRMEDLTYPQIARKTGVSIKAVEKHIRLALKQLAENVD